MSAEATFGYAGPSESSVATYSQYYATISLKPPFERPDSVSLMYEPGTGERRNIFFFDREIEFEVSS